jgi:hypothetical protein
LDSCEFVVLHPKVGLEGFDRGREPEQCRVSLAERATPLLIVVVLSVSTFGEDG